MRIALVSALLALSVTASAGAASSAPVVPLPPGSMIAGVDVGGLGPKAAGAALHHALPRMWGGRIFVHARHHRVALTSFQAGQTIRYGAMVKQAFALAAAGKPVAVQLDRTLSRRRLTKAVDLVGRRVNKPARDARVRFGIAHIARYKARNGLAVDGSRLRRALVRELLRPHARRLVRPRLVRVAPRVTMRDLASRYATYISIDRGSFRLRLFKHLRHAATYPIAVGRAGLATPAGLHRILWKETNPAWHVPNSAWAGSLAGQTIPAGDPRNPIKARYMAVGSGFGIHGTAESWSIGTRASHGCIRMRIPDVIALYARTPVGTPVLIR